jgi:hypothetical protein
VGESPPASGRHFYAANSALYRAVQDTFLSVCPPLRDRGDFRATFRDLGCGLTDLSAEPVDRLSPAERRAACRASEPRLASDLVALAPLAIVTVVRSIEPNVRRAISRADWEGEWLAIPYPGRWIRPRAEFVATLALALGRWTRSGVLRALRAPRSSPGYRA